MSMASIDDIVAKMKQNPQGVRFSDLSKVCDHYFGKPSIERLEKEDGKGN
jgi:hypothetical protein